MFNTDGRNPAHTTKQLDREGKNFIVVATEQIKRNQQICLSYGELANVELLTQFGFMLSEMDSPPERAFVDCTKLLEERLNADGGPEVRDESGWRSWDFFTTRLLTFFGRSLVLCSASASSQLTICLLAMPTARLGIVQSPIHTV